MLRINPSSYLLRPRRHTSHVARQHGTFSAPTYISWQRSTETHRVCRYVRIVQRMYILYDRSMFLQISKQLTQMSTILPKRLKMCSRSCLLEVGFMLPTKMFAAKGKRRYNTIVGFYVWYNIGGRGCYKRGGRFFYLGTAGR